MPQSVCLYRWKFDGHRAGRWKRYPRRLVTTCSEVGKENAASSSIDSGSIRWIEEDARSFVQRELRRGNRYDLIVLDPPTYGHGNKGDRWEVEVDLPRLLSDCVILLTEEALGVLLTGHSPNIEPEAALDRALRSRRNLSRSGTRLECGRSELVSTTGKSLDCGYYARWWSID